MNKLMLWGAYNFLFFFSCTCYAQSSGVKQTLDTKPFVLGAVHEIESTVLSEKRVLNIYLPPAYKDNDTATYPVIYLLDGSADEDFIHICGLVQYLTFPWINILQESIVVGIATVDRKRDFTYPTSIAKDHKDFPTQGGSKRFTSFLANELQPYIDTTFRTNSSRTIIGQSLGGLLATEIFATQPGLFNKYIIVSPSLWWDGQSLLKKPFNLQITNQAKQIALYLAVGNEGAVMEKDVRDLAAKLKRMERANFKVHFEYFPEETHATIYHRAAYKAFEALGR